MEFSNFSEEKELVESDDNPKGLSTKFIKNLVASFDSLDDKDLYLQMFQKDMPAATKKSGDWVKPSDKGYRSYSKAELQAQADDKI